MTVVPEAEARERGQEHASVDLDRPLAKALPIDYAWAVAQVEDVAAYSVPCTRRGRSASMVQLKTNPALDLLRDDVRFRDLVRRMKFPN